MSLEYEACLVVYAFRLRTPMDVLEKGYGIYNLDIVQVDSLDTCRDTWGGEPVRLTKEVYFTEINASNMSFKTQRRCKIRRGTSGLTGNLVFTGVERETRCNNLDLLTGELWTITEKDNVLC